MLDEREKTRVLAAYVAGAIAMLVVVRRPDHPLSILAITVSLLATSVLRFPVEWTLLTWDRPWDESKRGLVYTWYAGATALPLLGLLLLGLRLAIG